MTCLAKKSTGPRYTIECADFRDHDDEGAWRSYDLSAEGDTLEELLDSAVYFMTDQDGGSLGDRPADDAAAAAYIATEFQHKYQTCHCDGEMDDGRMRGFECDMHRLQREGGANG